MPTFLDVFPIANAADPRPQPCQESTPAVTSLHKFQVLSLTLQLTGRVWRAARCASSRTRPHAGTIVGYGERGGYQVGEAFGEEVGASRVGHRWFQGHTCLRLRHARKLALTRPLVPWLVIRLLQDTHGPVISRAVLHIGAVGRCVRFSLRRRTRARTCDERSVSASAAAARGRWMAPRRVRCAARASVAIAGGRGARVAASKSRLPWCSARLLMLLSITPSSAVIFQGFISNLWDGRLVRDG